VRALRLHAEALAWPLFDDGALRRADAHLDATALLPSFTQRAARLDCSAHVTEVVEAWWSAGTPLVDWTRHHAHRLVRREGQTWRLRGPHAMAGVVPVLPGHEVLQWRWITLAQPMSWLLAAATPRGQRPPSQVQLLGRHDAPPHPIAHHHLHVGAAHPFEHIWARLATHLSGRLPHPGGQHPSLPDDPAGTTWTSWLVRALVARRWLAHNTGFGPPWRPPVGMSLATAQEATTEALDDLLHYPRLPAGRRRKHLDAILRRVATARHDRPRTRPSADTDHIWALDPISDGRPWPEGAWLAHCAHHLTDPRAIRIFLQVLRLKTRLFRHLVSDPAQPGLSTFVQTFDRLWPIRSVLPLDGLHASADDPEVPLGAVEGRTAPPASRAALLDLVAPRRRSTDPSTPRGIEWGWTFHFIRAFGPLDPTDARSHPGHRLRQVWRAAEQGATVLADGFRTWPQLLSVVRAVDIAGDERNGPLWLMLPHIHRVHQAAAEAAAGFTAHHLPPLRTTLHAGEDFRTLIEGIRGVHEPIDWGLLRPGDRLGHALVLGWNPDRWLADHPWAEQPRWARLRDVIWMLQATEALEIPLLQRERDRLAQEARRLDRVIFGPPPAGDTSLFALGADLGTPDLLRSIRPHRTSPSLPTRGNARRLGALLYDADTACRAFTPLTIDPSVDHPIATQLHVAARTLVAQLRVCVEINPSSNLLIGGLGGPVDLPAFQILPVLGDQHDAPPISINTDDPTTFSTRLSDELAFARAGLVAGSGVAPGTVEAWLDRAGATSWRFRFTRPESADLDHHLPAPSLVPGYRRWARVGSCPSRRK